MSKRIELMSIAYGDIDACVAWYEQERRDGRLPLEDDMECLSNTSGAPAKLRARLDRLERKLPEPTTY